MLDGHQITCRPVGTLTSEPRPWGSSSGAFFWRKQLLIARRRERRTGPTVSSVGFGVDELYKQFG